MAHSKSVAFANFVCRFGDKHVLLDFAEQIVIPAFIEGGQRKYSESRYIIQNGALVHCGENEENLLIVGRFIKDTILSREQTLENGKLIKNKATMPSAPSAVFALVLDTHKLLYLPETAHAPGLSAFRATVSHIIRNRHTEYVNELYENDAGEGKRITKKGIIEKVPHPEIQVVPLSSLQDFENFLKQFAVLENIKIQLIDTNNEIDGMGLVRVARKVKNSIGAKGVTIDYKNNQGLSQKQALDAFASLAEDGNTKLMLNGKDREGAKLRGDNENFKMSVPIDTESDNPKKIGRVLYQTFVDKIKAGFLKIQKPEKSAVEKVRLLAQAYSKRN